jgi:biopolymer transport protein ExbB
MQPTWLVAVVTSCIVPAAAAQAAPAATLRTDLSIGGMFAQADVVVKLVVLTLLLASVLTWTVFIAKTLELRRTATAQRQANAALHSAGSLTDALGETHGAAPMLEAARTELRLSADALHDADGVKERIATRFNRIESEAGRSMTRGTHLLATIGATAPFVGLFGTVWGIMNSFIGIAEKQTTNLAVVAPGIAEALLATAVGLIAAIPAVVIYNHFARAVAAQRALVSDAAAAILNLVSRDLSRAGRRAS